MKLKLDSVRLEKKVRCTECNTKVMDGQVIQVVRNAHNKIKAYLCKTVCANSYANKISQKGSPTSTNEGVVYAKE